MTFEDYVPRFREKAYPWLKPRTRESYDRQLRGSLRSVLDLELATLPIHAGAELVWRLREAGRMPRTARLALSVFSSVVEAAIEDGQAAINPARHLPRPVRRWLSEVEDEDLALAPGVSGEVLVAAERKHRQLFAVYATYAYSAMRRNEALGLQVPDLRFGDLKITVARQWNGAGVVENSTKRNRRRVIPMAPQLVPILTAAVERSRAVYTLLGLPEDHPRWLFPNPALGVPYSPRHVNQFLRTLGRELGLGRVTPKMFRHTVASALHEQGETLGAIGDILGHADERTTRHYARHRRPQLRGGLEVLTRM